MAQTLLSVPELGRIPTEILVDLVRDVKGTSRDHARERFFLAPLVRRNRLFTNDVKLMTGEILPKYDEIRARIAPCGWYE